MKILDTTSISTSNAMPIKSGTLQFLQDASKEAMAALVTNLIPNPDVNTIYRISGCLNSTVAPIHTLSAGVLFYNGEIFNFDGATFTLTGLQKAYARIATTQFTTNADPVQFTDGVSRNVHNIRKIVIENTTTSSGLPEFKDFITLNSWLKGDTKEIVCDNTYLTNNFTSTGATAGLGIGERAGWAIMNGNNGTPNDNGKVVISYGSSYSTLGATGGSETHTLTVPELPTNNKSVHSNVAGSTGGGGSGAEPWAPATVNFGGSNTPFSVMQPYVVRLRIMKLY